MKKQSCNIGCILMAAGNAARFGANKLAAELGGESFIQRALDAIPMREFYKAALVTQYPDIAELGAQQGMLVCLNDQPELGLSHTIHLGMDALHDADALLFLVADQPLLRQKSVLDALLLYRDHPDRIVMMAYGERRGNPCIFPRAYFPELRALAGDHGGRSVIEQHEDALLLCEVADERELKDVDTPEELREIKRGK